MCSYRQPPCPDDFKWAQKFGGGTSCFHMPEQKIGAEVDEGTSQYHHQSFWTFNKYCTDNGAYLARPGNRGDFEVINKWIEGTELYRVSGDLLLEIFLFKINYYL